MRRTPEPCLTNVSSCPKTTESLPDYGSAADGLPGHCPAKNSPSCGPGALTQTRSNSLGSVVMSAFSVGAAHGLAEATVFVLGVDHDLLDPAIRPPRTATRPRSRPPAMNPTPPPPCRPAGSNRPSIAPNRPRNRRTANSRWRRADARPTGCLGTSSGTGLLSQCTLPVLGFVMSGRDLVTRSEFRRHRFHLVLFPTTLVRVWHP